VVNELHGGIAANSPIGDAIDFCGASLGIMLAVGYRSSTSQARVFGNMAMRVSRRHQQRRALHA